jgi:esterase/lipase
LARATSLACLIGSLICGCSIGSREVEAPAEYLAAAGWQDNVSLMQASNFNDYARAIREEVRRYRIPFDADNAMQETNMASPSRLLPANNCNGQSRGIAILVHGLSDTAFAMRDIGEALTQVCYESRLILLPGHGTRAGDLLTTRHSHWQDTLDYLIDQAVQEHDNIVLAGFSLGAVLTLDAAIRRPNDINGVIGISPAYFLSSSRIAKWAGLAAPLMRWVDRGVADDPMRYEAMPTRGVAETWAAMQHLQRNLKKFGPVNVPWMLAQSMDDAVVVPAENEALWHQYAANPHSQLIRFISDQQYPPQERTLNLPGYSDADRVIALTHLAIHQSPDNPHYGNTGSYRNCGGNMPRLAERVNQCEQAESVWYGLWSTEPEPGRPMAFSTFNPSFAPFAAEIKKFASRIADRDTDAYFTIETSQ